MRDPIRVAIEYVSWADGYLARLQASNGSMTGPQAGDLRRSLGIALTALQGAGGPEFRTTSRRRR